MGEAGIDKLTSGSSGTAARKRRAVSAVLIALALFAIGLIVVWRLQQPTSPVAVVDRLGRALKEKDWRKVYRSIDWSTGDARQPTLDEDRFVTMADAYSGVYSLQSYRIGEPVSRGDSATVPVTLTARITTLLASSTRSDTIDVQCRRLRGEWRIVPDVKNVFLGLKGLGGS